MFSFYMNYIPLYAQIFEPLHQHLNLSQPTQKRKNKANLLLNTMEPTYDWLTQLSESFSTLKEVLSKSVPLHISRDTTLPLTTDA